MSKSQAFVANSFSIIYRNVSRTFVELSMETPYWCTVLVHKYGRRKSTKSGVHFFSLFSRELAYVHIKILSYTWNGCSTKKERRDFFQRHSILIILSRTVKTMKFKLLYFRNETCYGNGNLNKDLFFVNLQPSLIK